MSLVIDDPEVEALVEKLRGATGESVTQAVGRAVKAEIANTFNLNHRKTARCAEALSRSKGKTAYTRH